MDIFRLLARKIRYIDLWGLELLERKLLLSRQGSFQKKITMPFVAIIGPPRVGSTLLYQILATQFSFFYFDNFQHAFFKYPYLSYQVSKYLFQNKSNFKSDHGFVSGFKGLSEGNFFWPYWFDMSLEQKKASVDVVKRQHIYQVLNQIYFEGNLPMVNSFNAHGFYLDEMKACFEKLIIINIRRSPVANALSLLRARNQLQNKATHWWSVKPVTCNDEEDVYKQISCQVIETYRQIKFQKEKVPDLPIIDVSYEDLCQNPNLTLKNFELLCAENDLVLQKKTKANLPVFEIRGIRPNEQKNAEIFAQLFESINWKELWG